MMQKQMALWVVGLWIVVKRRVVKKMKVEGDCDGMMFVICEVCEAAGQKKRDKARTDQTGTFSEEIPSFLALLFQQKFS